MKVCWARGHNLDHARGQARFKSPLDPVLSTLDFQFVRMQCACAGICGKLCNPAPKLALLKHRFGLFEGKFVTSDNLTILAGCPAKQPKNLIINQFPCSYLLVSSTLEMLETNFTYGWTCHAKGEELKRNTQKFVGFKVKTYSALSEQPVFIFCGAQSFPAKISLNSFDYDCRVVL